MIDEIKKEHVEEAIFVLRNILSAMHEKDYERVLMYVDSTELECMSELGRIIEMQGIDAVDDYDTECCFRPSYEYSQLDLFEYDDSSGFVLDYDLTYEGNRVDLTLQLEFIYCNNGLIKKFIGIDVL